MSMRDGSCELFEERVEMKLWRGHELVTSVFKCLIVAFISKSKPANRVAGHDRTRQCAAERQSGAQSCTCTCISKASLSTHHLISSAN